jgi:hypothetical protein
MSSGSSSVRSKGGSSDLLEGAFAFRPGDPIMDVAEWVVVAIADTLSLTNDTTCSSILVLDNIFGQEKVSIGLVFNFSGDF